MRASTNPAMRDNTLAPTPIGLAPHPVSDLAVSPATPRHPCDVESASRHGADASTTAWRRPLLLAAAAVLAGCATPPAPAPAPVGSAPPPPAPAPPPVAPAPLPPAAAAGPVSLAATPREYRRDAAGHIYQRNAHRIYRGMLPPLLYAIGVLQVDVDRQGRVTGLSWMRAPRHAPEVIAEIERTVREAAPFPQPTRMGRVTWTDTWLWDRSGRFQLDTLTEGQLGA